MLNSIKLRGCIAGNLLENSFSRLLWAFFIIRFSLILWICLCCALFGCHRRRRRLLAVDWLAKVYMLFFAHNFIYTLLNETHIRFDVDCAVPNHRCFSRIPFASYFCDRTSTMISIYICLARNMWNEIWQVYTRISYIASLKQISRFQKRTIYSFAIAKHAKLRTTHTKQIVKKINNVLNLRM